MDESNLDTKKPSSRRWQFSIAAMLGLMTVAALCAGVFVWLPKPPDNRAYPAKGRVTLKDGTPIQAGWIELVTVDLRLASIGEIKDGEFELSTYGHNDGCPPGEYIVIVGDTVPPAHERYASLDLSPLREDVKSKTENKFDIKLDPAE
ncbi:MAG: hypothetical protein RIC55_26505 [Pirellulaceae bacterium]